ncbi:hypothetical protein LUZ61_004093 [Rhynchospora tenuis]|uniref:BED-type domain-containing protein n=1 Tax=Rhynchospora tenuis TaxID=198213 RepID=A0AAD5ZM58_9POAL|nr:hypothetical protein LUZ61_004093 [Rhynchospora tenuis]
MADPKEVMGSVETVETEPSEPDIALDIEAENEMDLHPDLTGDQIERIVDGANAQHTEGANAEAKGGVQNTKKRKSRKNMTAEAWKHFIKGDDQEDGSYDATCKYCSEVFPMGNQRGTGSLNHHIKKGCEKIPSRFKRTRLQQMLQVQTVAGENKVAVWKFDQATCRKNFAIMVIVHEAFSLVLDNASSNDACIRELLSGPLKESLPADGSVFHQRCGCHILNLIVQDGLSELSDDIEKIREAMKYIRHSQARMEKFQLAISQVHAPDLRPTWDVPTRWNSTYLMLELALQLKPAFDRFAKHDKNFKLNLDNVEWEAVQALMECLKIFYNATLKFSATKYPSLNLFFPEMCEVFVNIKNMETSPYPFIVLMSKKMFRKWERYWTIGNTLLAIACVLDPRCKVQVVEYYLRIIYPDNYEWYVSNLKSCISSLFKEYLEAYSTKSQSQAGAACASTQSQSKQACGSSRATISQVRAGLKDFISGIQTSEPEKSELEEYLGLPLDKTSVDDEFDILTWWKMKVPKYPVLSRLARDILAVPASTVASESTFSTSGRTLSAVRNCLNDESMEALICAQDWLRARVTEDGGQVGAPLWDSTSTQDQDNNICGGIQE